LPNLFSLKLLQLFQNLHLLLEGLFLQSIIPADVLSRNSFTIFAEISATIFFFDIYFKIGVYRQEKTMLK